uniref:Transposase n=1 Tax=Drosophila simulans TaxID=7240 RepID=O62616_DROSI|nr:transposase [Drosophila simulans]AAC16611.1 transposase [Drosophila simulans]AAC16615.1 transposase [Drosophila simulans]
MSSFVPNKEQTRTVLIFCFHLKKTAAESHRMLVEAFGEQVPTVKTCERWFQRFKSGDFDVDDKEHGKPPKRYEDAELQALLDEDDAQTQKQLAEQLEVSQQAVSNRLREMGKIQKVGRWVPHELNERQMERRKNTCEILLSRYKRKSFLHRIVTGDEKWIFFVNPKRKKSYVDPGQPATSTARPNRFGKKTMLCVWWDQSGVIYYELLKPGETVNTARYQQQLINLNRALQRKRPEYQKRQHKVIFLHDNAPSHTARAVRDTLETLNWEVLPHAAYSPDLAPSDYHLFASMGHALAEQRFDSYESVKKWLDEWFAAKDDEFYWRGIHKLPERWEKCVASDGKYFE